MRVYDRAGNTMMTVALESLFGTWGQLQAADPQVVYHPGAGRWFMSLLSYNCGAGYLHLAVSDSGAPWVMVDSHHYVSDSRCPLPRSRILR